MHEIEEIGAHGSGSGRAAPPVVRVCLAKAVLGGSLLVACLFGAGFSVPAYAASCPNEQLRAEQLRVEDRSTALPDCRTYELVTPAFKNGQTPFATNFGASGSNLVFTSLGAFGKAEDDVGANGTSYLATHTGGGWASESIEPPASDFQTEGRILATLEDVTPNFRRSLFVETPVGAASQDERYYVREAGGQLTEVGPIFSRKTIEERKSGVHDEGEASYAGGSSELTHVLFYIRQEVTPTRFLWPFDTTVGGSNGTEHLSLYEYVGTGHSGTGSDVPALVGTRANGELISQCGIFLGGYQEGESASGDIFNAISTTGQTIFFTAEKGGCEGEERIGTGPQVNEVFARREASDGMTEAVPISEPTNDACEACDLSEPQSAIFQGASSDGSRVYFLSRQTLLPDASGQSLYEYDFNAPEGKKVTLVAAKVGGEEEVGGVVRMSRDGTLVYLVTAENELVLYNALSGSFTRIAKLAGAASGHSDASDWNTYADGPAEATPSGQFLLFQSTNDLTPDATGTGPALYRYDASTDQLVRVSIGRDGFNDDGNSTEGYYLANAAYTEHADAASPAISMSEDGSTIFFASYVGLTPDALNEQAIDSEGDQALNVYEWHELEGGQDELSLISDGKDTHEILGTTTVNLIGTTPSGEDVFFTTADPLVAADTDSQRDIYDARVDGGIAPVPAPASCSGSECRNASEGPPAFGLPASAGAVAPGNLVQEPAPPKLRSAAGARHESLSRALRRCTKLYRRLSRRKSCDAIAEHRHAPVKRTKAKTGGGR